MFLQQKLLAINGLFNKTISNKNLLQKFNMNQLLFIKRLIFVFLLKLIIIIEFINKQKDLDPYGF